jgi:hypothetical protein
MPLRNTTFIPAAMYNNLTNGLAADIASLTPEVDGSTAHKVAEVLSRYGLYPDDMAKQIIDEMADTAAEQLQSCIPSIVRPAA